MLVNDDQMELETIAGQLSADGDISVDIALSGEAALEKLANAKFDAVISDYMAPPAMNGIDLLRNARARGYMGLFLLFTDKCDEALALDDILNGADHFLPRCDGSRKDVALIRSLLLKRVQRSEDEGGRQDAEAYHSLLMRIPDGFAYHQVIFDSAGGLPTTMITDANDVFERTFLPSEESVLGRTSVHYSAAMTCLRRGWPWPSIASSPAVWRHVSPRGRPSVTSGSLWACTSRSQGTSLPCSPTSPR